LKMIILFLWHVVKSEDRCMETMPSLDLWLLLWG
jgi:hypothetical protein